MDHLPACVYTIQGHVECQSGCRMKTKQCVGALDYKQTVQPMTPFDRVHVGPPQVVVDGKDTNAYVATKHSTNIDGSYLGFFKQTP